MDEFKVGDNMTVNGRVGVVMSYDPAFSKPYLVEFPNGDEMRVALPVAEPAAAHPMAEQAELQAAREAYEAAEVAYIEATAGILKDDMTLAEWEDARQNRQRAADALILAMKDRLTAQQRRIDALEKALKERQGILTGTGIYNDWHQMARYLDSIPVTDLEDYKVIALGMAVGFFHHLADIALHADAPEGE